MLKLMGYLAQFASFSKQGELLCTQSLAHLLSDIATSCTFAKFLSAIAGASIPDIQKWRAEYRQSDGCRPDLEGCDIENIPIVKIEAKLDAQFGEEQLSSYKKDLDKNDFPSCLIILVPEYRRKEATKYTAKHFCLQGEGPWKINNVSIAIITWEDLLQELESTTSKGVLEDLAQLNALYRSLNGDDMAPLTTDEEALSWRDRQNWWEKIVDITTRRLTSEQGSLLPLGTDNKGSAPYFRRYVIGNIQSGDSFYSIGVRDPFQSFKTPIWLRFHKDTGRFKKISQQLEQSLFADKIVRSGRHIWYPLEVPYNADSEVMISSLTQQTEQILAVAYQSGLPEAKASHLNI